MDIKTIFVKTSKGEDESKKITNHLPSDIKRALGLIDNQSTVKELMKRAAPSLRESLDDMLQELVDGGFIQDKEKVNSVVKMAIPRRPIQKIVIPLPKVEGLGERQDAIRVIHVSDEVLAAETALIKAEQEAEKIRAELEVAQAMAKMEAEAKARADAETLRIKAEQEAARIRAELEVAQAREKAEAKARADAETLRIKAEQEAARIRAEQEAASTRAKAAAETARIKAEQEAEKIRAELEVAQAMAKMEAEAKVRADAETLRIKAEQEAARIRAEQEAASARAKAAAETARIKAEQESEKIRAELEVAQAREKAEAKARADAETLRIKAEQEAARIRAEQEAAQARAKVKAEAKVHAEAEVTRIKEGQQAIRVKAEHLATLTIEKAKVKAKARDEAAARIKAEQEATRIREEQEAAQARAKEEAEAVRLKAEQVAAQIKAEQEVAQAKVEAEAKAHAVVEALHIKEEQEALKVRAKQEAEQATAKVEMEAAVNARAKAETARLNAEQETLKIRSELEAEQVKSKVEAKAKVHSEAETARLKGEQEETRARVEQETALAKKKAEALRLKAEQDVSEVRYELEAEQAKSQVEAKARARAEAETARLKREQEAARVIVKKVATQAREKMEMAAKVRAKAEESRIIEEQDAIKVKAKHLATLLTIEKEETKARDETAARIKAEQDAAKIRADQEAVKITVDLAAVKIRVDQEAAKIKAAHEAAKIKAAQEAAKIKAAQEAAQTVAKAKMKAAVKIQAAQVPEMKAVQRVAITRSKPLPWGRIATGLILLLSLLAVLLPYVWPMQSCVTQIEQKLSAQLQQPVHVGHLRATLLPQPKLELEGVFMGGNQELKASSVVLNFNFFELLSDIKSIHSLEINDLILNAKYFDKALPWLQIAGGDTHYPVARMVLQRARVSDDELVLPSVNGVVNFDGQRRFAKAVLKSVDGKLSLELQPQKSHWQIALVIKGGYVPLLPNILFNELTAKGELGAGEIKFHEIEGGLYGGLLTGSTHLSWLKGWKMQGLVDVTAMKLLDALPKSGIAGELDGHANFILRGERLPLLAKIPHLEGKFLVKKGLINTIDMVETARMPNRKAVSSGRTHFDEFSGLLQIDNNTQHLHQIKMSNSVMGANGHVDVAANKQLSGRLNVNLKVRADLGSVPLVLSGTLSEPVWSTGR